MIEYQKIETLYKFDNVTKTYRKEFFNPYVDYLKDNEWIASEKIDGTNVQVEYDGHRVAFHGRTERTNFPKEVLAALTGKFADSEVVFEQMFGDKPVILFMECYGGIMKENEHDVLATFDPQIIVDNWDKIRSIIAEIPSAEEMEALYKAVGSKYLPEHIGIDPALTDEMLPISAAIRNRLTLVRMLRVLDFE